MVKIKKDRQVDISGFRHLYPFTSRYININALKYHYVDEGAGDPVVMLHGNPTWSFYFRELIKTLSFKFRVLAPDHIGCGLSDKPDATVYDYRLKSRVDDLEYFLDRLDIKNRITLVLHDWGGMIGMAYALRHRERIANIIIMNTAAFFPEKEKRIPLRLRLIRNIKPLAVLSVLGLNVFARSALYMASSGKLPQAVKQGLTAPYNCWKNRIATLKFVQDIPVNEKDPSYGLVKYVDENLHRLVGIPMLICWGMRDFVFDKTYLAKWQQRFPDAKVHTFPNAGHYVLEDEADRVVACVTDFLKNR